MLKRVETLLDRHGLDFFSRIGKLGFQSTVDKYFGGDREAAKRWLVAKGQWTIDQGLSYSKPGVWEDPGPHPAEIARMRQWLDHAESNITGYNASIE